MTPGTFLLAAFLQVVCLENPIHVSVSPSTFKDVRPGESRNAVILLQNRDQEPCPATNVRIHVETKRPVVWPVSVDGEEAWTIEPKTFGMTTLHIQVPKEATTGSVVVNVTVSGVGDIPVVVNVKR